MVTQSSKTEFFDSFNTMNYLFSEQIYGPQCFPDLADMIDSCMQPMEGHMRNGRQAIASDKQISHNTKNN